MTTHQHEPSQEDSQNTQNSSFQKNYNSIGIPKENLKKLALNNSNADSEDFLILKKQADEGSSEAQYKLGSRYDAQKSYKLAFHYYKLAADQGHRSAQLFLGMLYYDGFGVEQNYQRAFDYYQLAAEQDSSVALVKLGKFYEEGKGFIEKSSKEAIHYYEMAADLDNPIAMRYLAEAYEKGIDGIKSIEKALFYRQKRFLRLKKDADEGDATAQCIVGSFFENGEGVEKSLESAFKYYKMAANQNDSTGLFNLAECFAEGKGVQKSFYKAIHYYKLASKRGNRFAQTTLGYAYLYGKLGVKKCPEKAFEQYRLAASQGSEYALEMIARCYEKGEGVERSPEKAFEFYRAGAEIEIREGYGDCTYALGRCYEEGIGTEKSLEKAIYYYRLAAENGVKAGLYRAAACCNKLDDPNGNNTRGLNYIKMALGKITILRGNSS